MKYKSEVYKKTRVTFGDFIGKNMVSATAYNYHGSIIAHTTGKNKEVAFNKIKRKLNSMRK